jgi:hypothetical protein
MSVMKLLPSRSVAAEWLPSGDRVESHGRHGRLPIVPSRGAALDRSHARKGLGSKSHKDSATEWRKILGIFSPTGGACGSFERTFFRAWLRFNAAPRLKQLGIALTSVAPLTEQGAVRIGEGPQALCVRKVCGESVAPIGTCVFPKLFHVLTGVATLWRRSAAETSGLWIESARAAETCGPWLFSNAAGSADSI